MNEHRADLASLQRDVEYYQAHQAELLARYPEQWVAIFDEQVAEADPDIDRLLDKLEQRGVPREQALVERVTSEDDLLILPA